MTIETATYVGDLDTSKPAASDPRSEGDDHLRLLKSALQATWPGMAGRFNRFQAKSGNYTAVLNDANSIINFSVAATLSLTAAATLGNGWACFAYAAGGAVTVDPNGAETINGAASFTVAQGNMALIYCTGTAFFAFSLAPSSGFESGTRTIFQQTTAPVGWTKETNAAYNDAAIKLTTSSVTTGGGDAFSTVFGAGKTTAGHSITQAELPNCSFPVTDPTHAHAQQSNTQLHNGGGNGWQGNDTLAGEGGTTGYAATGISVASGGSGTAHTHGLTLDMKYASFCVCQKD